MNRQQNTYFPASREESLKRLREFIPKSGRYSRDRNHVVPGHENVTLLSPAIRYRLLTEYEVAEAPLDRYAFSTVEKFIQEVYWRRYWKSWLSLRPQVWTDYLRELHEIKSDSGNADILGQVDKTERGLTGTAVMDNFAKELTDTGYLHNHARMWFAAWWVHVKRLPWQLGADFFFRHLLDGDPASNTLSWRWVAGLQTPGKTYLPRRSNIEKYLHPELLDSTGIEVLEKPQPYIPYDASKPQVTQPELPDYSLNHGLRTGIWVHEEDLCPEHSPLDDIPEPKAIIVSGDAKAMERHGYPERKIEWIQNALDDAASRCGSHFSISVERSEGSDLIKNILTWAEQNNLEQIAALRPGVGPLADDLPNLISKLEDNGLRLALVDRREDLALRPLATAGFFNFWKKIQPKLKECADDEQKTLSLFSQ